LFQISDSASKQFKAASQAMDGSAANLRIAAKKTPNQGIVYNMGFDDPKEEDVKYDINGISVIVDKETDVLVDKMVIDYREYHNQEQFVFINPNDSCQTETGESKCDASKPECQGCMGE